MADVFLANTSTTGVIWEGLTINSEVETSGDRDWFRITLGAGVNYQFDLSGSFTGFGKTLNDPLLIVRDALGNLVTQNYDDGGPGFDSRVLFTPTVTGTYFLDAGAFSTGTGTYRLNVSSPDQFGHATSLLNNFAAAQGWTSQDATPRTFADVNGDNRDDIIGFTSFGVLVSLNTSAAGTGFTGPVLASSNFGSSQGWNSQDRNPRHVADVNGDGFDDIVGFGDAGVFVALANGTGGFGAAQLRLSAFAPNAGGWNSDNIYHRELADVNGDGRADIVGFGDAGVFVSLATGGGNFGALQFTSGIFGAGAAGGGWSSQDLYTRHLADVNGDSRADIVGFGQAGTWVALSTGTGTFGPMQLRSNDFGASTGWTSDALYHREVGDVNGDFIADIVGFGQAGVYTALATGGGNFGPMQLSLGDFGPGAGGWVNDNTYHRELADVNGDLAMDVVGFGLNATLGAVSTYHYDWTT